MTIPAMAPADRLLRESELDAGGLLLIERAGLRVTAMVSIGIIDALRLLLMVAGRLRDRLRVSVTLADRLGLLLIIADGLGLLLRDRLLLAVGVPLRAGVLLSVGLILPVGLPGGVRLLSGVGVSEHWNSPTVHATVALGLTVQLVVTKVHTVAEGIESKTQPERVILTE
jgi:hypothetical protein